MAVDFQVVLDCADPHPLARFWAAALGYEVEDNSAMIDGLLANGAVPEEMTVVYDGRREWAALVALRHPDDPVDERTGAGKGRRMLLIAVPEAKSVKNRMHLDLKVGTANLGSEAARLESLGATVVARISEHGSEWITLADPEGNEFDIA